MANPQLLKIIARLTQLIPLERIYLSTIEYDGTLFKELCILLPSSAKMHVIEARPLVSMVMADYPEYRFRMFYVQEIKRALQYGSMVFYTICREENLVYQSERWATILPTDLTAQSVLKRAKRNFAKEYAITSSFKDGFQFYLAREDYPLAAFMIHQVIELSYRTAELLVIGKEKISHSIRNHQKSMGQYVPKLGQVFNEDDESEASLLSLLDEAYSSVRYEDTYVIDKFQLNAIANKAELLEQQIVALYDLVVAQFKNQCVDASVLRVLIN